MISLLSRVLLPYLVSRTLILLLAILLEWLLVSGSVKRYAYLSEAPLSPLSSAFDANWYGGIASGGYNTSPDLTQQHNYHFLPLYPSLMRVTGDLVGLGAIDGGYNLAGVVLSHIFFIAALMLLYQLTSQVWKNESLAMRAVWLMCALPWSFVFSMTYTESLFLALTLAALLVAYRAREKPDAGQALLAGLLAMFAALTRQQGILVALAAVWLLAITPRGVSLAVRIRNALLGGAPAILAFGAFALYIGVKTGNLLAVIQAKGAWGEGWVSDLYRVFILPPANPAWSLDFMETIALVTWTVLTIAVVALALSLRRSSEYRVGGLAGWAFVGYATASYLLAITNAQANQSWGRYMLVAFPCVWVLGGWLSKETTFLRVVIVSIGFQAVFFAAAIIAQVTP
jgi:hypothetical protein